MSSNGAIDDSSVNGFFLDFFLRTVPIPEHTL